MNTKKINLESNKGFALFVAVVTVSILLSVSFAIINITLKELTLSMSGRDSQYAFYASNAGLECALYWDFKGNDPFSPYTEFGGNEIICNGISKDVGDGWVSNFNLIFAKSCVDVEITKSFDGVSTTTIINSRGYNTCNKNNVRRIERAVRVSY